MDRKHSQVDMQLMLAEVNQQKCTDKDRIMDKLWKKKRKKPKQTEQTVNAYNKQ